MEGYEKLPEFSVQVNGITVDTSSGIYSLKSVTGVQKITVDGIQMKKFKVTAGKNTVLKVGGFAVNTATVEDLIEVVPNGIYEIPQTFNDNLPLTAKVGFGGYKITGDAIFPSIVMVTIGKNVLVNDSITNTVEFFCTVDCIKIKASSGYNLPDDYVSKLLTSGIIKNRDSYSFSKDVMMPSVFKVSYIPVSKLFKVFFVSDGDKMPEPDSIPIRAGYNFEGWDNAISNISYDLTIIAKWVPIKYNIKFGENICYSINGGKLIDVPSTLKLTVEDTVAIFAKAPHKLPAGYLSTLELDGKGSHIRCDFEFKSIYYVVLCHNGKQLYNYVTEGEFILPYSNNEAIASLFEGETVNTINSWKDQDGTSHTFKLYINRNTILDAEV